MPFNGAGTFALSEDSCTVEKAASIKVRADKMDLKHDDFATALTNTLCKDGQSSPTANISLNTWQLTNVGNGTTNTAAATVGQVQVSGPT